ncbi:hypothetical protein SARC_11731 [Sphaeroforma arctica JP610]|uniref:Uncharacterized protein n=1 Tax=Sphaeroforma arctica JP610 TaxID=667725 RepID=A0A0L0FG51_9EUKA|nr:hypothetical protein SARC_11731 [Sphaeroforma arctica JP610]KNC75749.1 hypothetical protein SARC_11731 [Sphaeroforma arctica JP610]|eukprot:XP_014149651.1 hypothetical protein SARC_11731 [Sphaeroforma arctica JP610]
MKYISTFILASSALSAAVLASPPVRRQMPGFNNCILGERECADLPIQYTDEADMVTICCPLGLTLLEPPPAGATDDAAYFCECVQLIDHGGILPPIDGGGILPPIDEGGILPPIDEGGLLPPVAPCENDGTTCPEGYSMEEIEEEVSDVSDDVDATAGPDAEVSSEPEECWCTLGVPEMVVEYSSDAPEATEEVSETGTVAMETLEE